MTRGWAIIALLTLLPAPLQAAPPGRITGVGGIFVSSKDPKALAAWYRDVLGMPLEPWGGAAMRYDAPGHPSMVFWNPYPIGDSYAAPSKREFMIDFAVDDMYALLARLADKGVPILKRETDSTGSFAWILDPDGTKIELWQPKTKP
jgi:catechol 2,3-dioxygenase-like lactoylglutathione lyase family enzyme